MPYYEFWWDERSLEKLAINEVTPDEFESIVSDPVRVECIRSSGLPLAIGQGHDGRLIACVYLPIDEMVVQPITAFYIEPQ